MSRMKGQADEAFGNADAYTQALRTLLAQGVPPRHLVMLREHYRAPKHTLTWEALALKVGYSGRSTVQLQFGSFAGRVAKELGVHEPPEGFWLYVVAKWSEKPARDAQGHTLFTLRAPVRKAMEELGVV